MKAWKSILILFFATVLPSFAALPVFSLASTFSETTQYTKPLTLNDVDIPINTVRVNFREPVSISSYHFLQPVSFSLSKFDKELTLSELNFTKNLNFNWAVFLGKARFFRVNMDSSGHFYFTYFNQPVIFNKVYCNKACLFLHSFFKNVKFLHSTFNQMLSFEYVNAQQLVFQNCQFEGDVNMRHMKVENLTFDNSFLYKGLNLSSAKFSGALTFINTELYGYLDLSYIEMSEFPIDLTMIKTPNDGMLVKLNLMGADIERIKLNYLHFKLYFPQEASPIQVDDIYLRLLRNFKSREDTVSYKILLAEYRHLSYLRDNKYLTDLISKHWWNYSTNPDWIFYWMGILIIFYTTINTIFYEKLSMHYFDIPFLVTSLRPFYVKKNPIIRFVYYFPRALLFTFLMFFGTQFRMRSGLKEFKSNNIFVNLYFIIIIITGMLCMFFILRYLIALISS